MLVGVCVCVYKDEGKWYDNHTNKTDLTIEKINGADTYKDDTTGGGEDRGHAQAGAL